MQFKIEGGVNADGSWQLNAIVPNGETVMAADVEEVCFRAMCHFRAQRGLRMPTMAEIEASKVVLPNGWVATYDGVNTLVIDGATTWSRSYAYEGGVLTTEAPCNFDGTPTADTCTALLAASNTEA